MTLEQMRRFVKRKELCSLIKLYSTVDLDYGRIDDPVKFRKEQAKYGRYATALKALSSENTELFNTYKNTENEEHRIYSLLANYSTIQQFVTHGKNQREIIQLVAAKEELTFFQSSKIVTRILDISQLLERYCKLLEDDKEKKHLLYRLTSYFTDYFKLFHKKEFGLPYILPYIPKLKMADGKLEVKHSFTEFGKEPPYAIQNWRCNFIVVL